MIYVDSCIPMYLVGAAHPNKQRVMERVPQLLAAREQLVTSAEAFQELIHRYRAINNVQYLHIAYEAMEEIVEFTEPVTKEDTDAARDLASRYPALSSRDCIHAAVMKRLSCSRIWTYDGGFSKLPAVTVIQ